MKTIYKTLVALLFAIPASLAWAEGTFKLPDYKTVQLDNGVTLYLMQQTEVPLIDINVVVSSGAIYDGDKAGLATMTSENLLFGTQKLDKNALEAELEFVGAQFNTGAALDFSRVSASFAKKDKEPMLAILADVVMSPRFDADEFDKYKQRYIGSLKRSKESPRSVIQDYFNQLIFEGHPYSASVGGDETSATAMSIDDLKGFYQAHYRPSNTAVVAVGDFDVAAMQRQLTGLFGGWKVTGDAPAKITFPAQKDFDQARVLLVNKSDARESTFLIGGKGVDRSNPDFVALSVINTILGARFTSWLNDELRVNSGLTYGARSRFNALKEGGSFYISTFTANRNTEAAIDLALETYNRLWEKGIDAETLKSAKAYVKGQFPPRYETSSDLAGLLGSMHIYGIAPAFINDFTANIDGVDQAQTKRLIKQYFPRENLQFTVVGKAEEIKDIVKKYGKVTTVDIEQPGFSLN